MSRLSLRASIAAPMLASLVVLGASSGRQLWNARVEVTDASRASKRIELALNLFVGLANLRVERGTAYAALTSPPVAGDGVAEDLLRSRGRADAAMRRAMDSMLEAQDAALLRLGSSYSEVVALRLGTDHALASHMAEFQLAEHFSRAVEDLVGRIDAVIASIDDEIKTVDPELTGLLTIRRLGWVVRDQAGRDRLSIGQVLSGRKSMGAEFERETIQTRAHIEGAWSSLLAISGGQAFPPEVTGAIDEANRVFFKDYLSMRDLLQAGLKSNVAADFSAAEWLMTSKRPLDVLLDVPMKAATLAHARSLQRVNDLAHKAFLELLWVLALAGCSVLSLGVVFIRVISPLAGLTARMRQLVGGNIALAVPFTSRTDEVGEAARALQAFRDALVVLEEQTQAQERTKIRLDAALNNMTHGLAMFDAERRLVICNAAYGDLYDLPAQLRVPGTTHESIIRHRVVSGIYPGGDPEAYVRERLKAASEGEATGTVELRGRIIALARRRMLDGGYVTVHEDITARREAEAKIEHMARHDPLTDLPNRTLLRESLECLLPLVRGGQRLALHCLDLDRFKVVNDTLGHPIGDRLLCAVASRLRSCLGTSDIVARIGGDEFAVLQIGFKLDGEPSSLAERIHDTISSPYEIDGHQIVIGTSIGIALACAEEIDPDLLFRQADLALYKAKADGKGLYRYFEADMDAALQMRRELEVGLRKAIQMGEFELNYQPLVDISTGEVTSCEALIRWNHPQKGRISPADFIPLAEETGLINAIGRWVLERACHDASHWPAHVRVAVNVSAVQFKSAGLIDIVKAALRQSGLSATRLEIEITESLLLLDNDLTFDTLHGLRDLGVRISMDDFGTGCSSLSYLRSFPFDKIKIDRSFVSDMCTNIDSQAIVKAVAGIGDSLGIPVTAEGVETQEQLEHLMLQGCTEAQGYLFSRPQSSQTIRDFLSTRPARAA